MSRSTEEYLEALYTLTQDGQTATTTALSKRLNVAPASVTEMLGKLAENGYINHERYQGITLTPEGYKLAEKMAANTACWNASCTIPSGPGTNGCTGRLAKWSMSFPTKAPAPSVRT